MQKGSKRTEQAAYAGDDDADELGKSMNVKLE